MAIAFPLSDLRIWSSEGRVEEWGKKVQGVMEGHQGFHSTQLQLQFANSKMVVC